MNHDLQKVSFENVQELVKNVRNLTRQIGSLINKVKDKKLQYGDIIGVCRGFYDHYGVYVNESRVIHYSAGKGDFGEDAAVREVTLHEFLDGDGPVFKLVFPPVHRTPTKIVPHGAVAFLGNWDDIARQTNYKLYTPEETVQRAESRLNERDYSLVLNNCEHFAIWCKTGISESHQVNQILKPLKKLINGEFRH